jgi:hypothetical protein
LHARTFACCALQRSHVQASLAAQRDVAAEPGSASSLTSWLDESSAASATAAPKTHLVGEADGTLALLRSGRISLLAAYQVGQRVRACARKSARTLVRARARAGAISLLRQELQWKGLVGERSADERLKVLTPAEKHRCSVAGPQAGATDSLNLRRGRRGPGADGQLFTEMSAECAKEITQLALTTQATHRNRLARGSYWYRTRRGTHPACAKLTDRLRVSRGG